MQLNSRAQEAVFPGLTSDELLEEIVNAYKPTDVLSYGDARDLMYGTIYNQNDSVSCVYTGHTLYLPQNVDPSIHLYMNGAQDGINNEHTYPSSKGGDVQNGFSDMHHLFPTKTNVNAARGNLPFGNIDDTQTETWYYLDQSQNDIPTVEIDLFSERINGVFEPREDHKGNVARAVLYFFTMYKEAALAADPNFFESQRETLCEWHTEDPADELEIERTNIIASYQNDLPNPFVIDATLVERAYCGVVALSTKPRLQNEVFISPNPVIDSVEVVTQGISELLVMDLLGRVLLRKEFSDKVKVDFSPLRPGTYLMSVNGQISKILKQ